MITEQAGIPRHSAIEQQLHHAEHTNGRTSRATARLRAVIAQQGAASAAKAAALKPDVDLRTPLHATATAIKCALRPGATDDSHSGGSARRFALAAAAIAAAALAAVAVRRAR